MKTITVCKASPVVRDMPVESICLKISGDIEAKNKSVRSMEEMEHSFLSEADMVMQALSVLPKGTRHRLLIMLLQESPSYYIG